MLLASGIPGNLGPHVLAPEIRAGSEGLVGLLTNDFPREYSKPKGKSPPMRMRCDAM